MLVNVLKPMRSYGQFIVDPANRDLSSSHVEKIAESADDLYLFDLYPIVVDSEGVIQDGQHRFSVCRQMMFPFYFIVGDDISIDDVAEANENTKRYSDDDVASVYAAMDVKPYSKLEEYVSENSWATVNQSARWLNKNEPIDRGTFARGSFAVRSPEYACSVARVINDIIETHPFVRESVYKRVFANLVQNPNYDHARMLDRLSRRPKWLMPCGREEDAFGMVNEIYNFNKEPQNRIRLEKLPNGQLLNRYDRDSFRLESDFVFPKRSVLSQKSVEVYCSDDLSCFVPHPSARRVQQYRLERLIKFMQRRNLLQYFPIVVDRDFVVHDGQMRLAAARELGIPIYYIVAQNISMPMMACGGVKTLSWRMDDYLKHFCVMGNTNYLKLKKFWSSYQYIKLITCLRMMSRTRGRYELEHAYKSGKFCCDYEDRAYRVARAIDSIRVHALKSDRTFQMAMWYQAEHPKFDLNLFVGMLEPNPLGTIHPYATTEGCINRIQEIYNSNVSPEDQVVLIKPTD